MLRYGHKPRSGFSLTEVVVVIVVVSLALPPMAILLHATLSKSSQFHMQAMATALARGLMEEILPKSYEDPEGSAGSFATEEASRAQYDDVDDYDGLNDMPPRDSQGNVLSSYTGFRTCVVVQNVAADSPGGAAEPDGSTDFKRVAVTVSWNNGDRLVRLIGLSSNFGSADGPKPGLTFIERMDSNDRDAVFRIRNDTDNNLYITHFIVTWNSPDAYYERIKLNAEGYHDYKEVWDYKRYNDIRMGKGGIAMCNKGQPALVPSGTIVRIELDNFSNKNRGKAAHRDVKNTTFTVKIWAAPDKYLPLTVPPEP